MFCLACCASSYSFHCEVRVKCELFFSLVAFVVGFGITGIKRHENPSPSSSFSLLSVFFVSASVLGFVV